MLRIAPERRSKTIKDRLIKLLEQGWSYVHP
jgi:hypothetical protein